MNDPVIVPLGEAALTIRLGDAASVEVAERCAALADLIRREEITGVTDVVSAVASVSVYYELQMVNGKWQMAKLRELIARSALLPPSATAFTTHNIATRYDGVDLDEIAERVALSRDEVIRRHMAREYRVLAIGFLPGWGYLGVLDPTLSLPRRATPRTRIPSGSVAIMGSQTGIYPRVSPGGWHLVGTTDAVLFDAQRAQPSLFRAGDRVRFTAAG